MRIAECEHKIAELERKVGQLTMEVDLLKKGGATGTRRERRELLDRERGPVPSPSRKDAPAHEARALNLLLPPVPTGRGEKFPRHGYQRITAQLRLEAMNVNHKTVARVMRESRPVGTSGCCWSATVSSRSPERGE